MYFTIVGRIQNVKAMAIGPSVRIRKHLNQKFGAGRWRKMSGDAMIRFDDGTVARAELHWFEAHGIGRVYFKRKEESGLAVVMTRGGRSVVFAVCIRNGAYEVDLIVGKLYQVVKPKRNDRPSDVRVRDESGEDYLYPRSWFIPVELPSKAKKILTGSR